MMRNKIKSYFPILSVDILIAILLFSCNAIQEKKPGQRWSEQKAWEWHEQLPWLVGCNFNPSTSINQLEMWQAQDFDPSTIDRELSWAANLGMNVMRVYLHNLVWENDSIGFKKRLNKYLEISSNHGIRTIFVLLDDVWDPVPKYGQQPDPMPHVHNSRWVQSPGAEILGDTARHIALKPYIQGVVGYLKDDERVLMWDIYNEPDNVNRRPTELGNKHVYSLSLIKKVVNWIREVNPSQPISSGLWRGNINHWGTPDSLPSLDRFMVENSDIITFHAYDGSLNAVESKIAELEKYGRPMICTEYLARGNGNTFEQMMPLFKEKNIGAINWGLVAGKTQTQYPWISWDSVFTSEPAIWHHDIFRPDGSAFSEKEIGFIKNQIEMK